MKPIKTLVIATIVVKNAFTIEAVVEMKIDTKSEHVKNMTDSEFEIYMPQEKNLRIEVDVKYLMDEIIGLEKILHHFDSSGPVENVQVRQKLSVLRSRHERLLDEKFDNEKKIKKLSRMV